MPIPHREGPAVYRELEPRCVERWVVARRVGGRASSDIPHTRAAELAATLSLVAEKAPSGLEPLYEALQASA